MSHVSDARGVRQNARAVLSNGAVTRAGIALLVAVAALAASPHAQPASAAPESPARGVVAAGSTTSLAAFVTSPVPEQAPEPESEPTAAPTTTPSGALELSNPLVVVNHDGSATISAEFRNGTSAELALMSVRVQKGSQTLPVASTMMWMPVSPGIPAWVGDASDAGGFVIPAGLVTGPTLTLRFAVDNGLCLETQADVVARSSKHSMIYPKRGSVLGPASLPDDSTTCQLTAGPK